MTVLTLSSGETIAVKSKGLKQLVEHLSKYPTLKITERFSGSGFMSVTFVNELGVSSDVRYTPSKFTVKRYPEKSITFSNPDELLTFVNNRVISS